MSFRRRQYSTINIGKNGLTEQVVEEIKRRLKREKVVKVRVLRNSPLREMDRRRMAETIAEAVQAELCSVRGFTILLVKRE